MANDPQISEKVDQGYVTPADHNFVHVGYSDGWYALGGATREVRNENGELDRVIATDVEWHYSMLYLYVREGIRVAKPVCAERYYIGCWHGPFNAPNLDFPSLWITRVSLCPTCASRMLNKYERAYLSQFFDVDGHYVAAGAQRMN